MSFLIKKNIKIDCEHTCDIFRFGLKGFFNKFISDE